MEKSTRNALFPSFLKTRSRPVIGMTVQGLHRNSTYRLFVSSYIPSDLIPRATVSSSSWEEKSALTKYFAMPR